MKTADPIKESLDIPINKFSLPSLKTHLNEARHVFESVYPDEHPNMLALDELLHRLDKQKFHLAVLGQFKRGKSTLMNALMGAPLLPTSVVPLTAVPTLVEYGEQFEVLVHYVQDKEAQHFETGDVEQTRKKLEDLVTEEGNPGNERGIERVVLRTPCALLKQQVVLIDTPGIGSTNIHNTVTTRDFLSQCDAAIFVVSADPPLTEQEAQFLSQVEKHVARIFFVMNKMDYLRAGQLQQAVRFLERTLADACEVDPGPVFCISAYMALEARMKGDEDGYLASGLFALEKRLEDFLLQEKASVLFAAILAKAKDVVSGALMNLELRLKSMRMPLDKLHDSLGVFDEKLKEINQQRQVAEDRLEGDERRATQYLESEIEKLRQRTVNHLDGMVQKVLHDVDLGDASESDLSVAFETEVPKYFRQALVDMADEVSSHVKSVLDARRKEADDLIRAVRKAASDIFDIPYRAPSASSVFKIDTRVYWDTHKWTPSYSPIPEGSLDKLLPAKQRRKRLERRWSKQVQLLVEQNSETLRWELLQGMKKAFWSYKTSLDKRLKDTLQATEGAMRTTLEKRESSQRQTAKSIEQLAHSITSLEDWLDSQPPELE